MPFDAVKWWDVPIWYTKITGMQMDSLDLKLEVGQHPKLTANLSIKRLIEEMCVEELKKLIKYCVERLECHI